MKKSSIASAILALGFLKIACAAGGPFAGGRWLDLTHDFSSDTIYWPTAEGFALETEFKGVTPKGYFYTANRYHASVHGGTHLDAPIHFTENGKTLDQLTGAAVVVDVSAKALQEADYQITVADLKAWETKHGQIPKGAILLLSTGFARSWPDARKYLGTTEKGPDAVAKLHFPGLHPDATQGSEALPRRRGPFRSCQDTSWRLASFGQSPCSTTGWPLSGSGRALSPRPSGQPRSSDNRPPGALWPRHPQPPPRP